MTTGEGWNVPGLVNREPAKQNQNGSIGSILWENLTGSSGRRQTDVNDKTLLSSLPNRIHAATEEAGSGTTFHPVWSPLPLITVLGPSVVQNHHGGLDIFMKKCCIFCSRITSAAAAKHSVNRKMCCSCTNAACQTVRRNCLQVDVLGGGKIVVQVCVCINLLDGPDVCLEECYVLEPEVTRLLNAQGVVFRGAVLKSRRCSSHVHACSILLTPSFTDQFLIQALSSHVDYVLESLSEGVMGHQ